MLYWMSILMLVTPGVMAAFYISPYFEQFKRQDGSIDMGLIARYREPTGFRPVDIIIALSVILPIFLLIVKIRSYCQEKNCSEILWIYLPEYNYLVRQRAYRLGRKVLKIELPLWFGEV